MLVMRAWLTVMNEAFLFRIFARFLFWHFFFFCGFSLNDLEAETGTIKKEIKEVEKVSIHKKKKRWEIACYM